MTEPKFEPLMPNPLERKAYTMIVHRNLRPTKEEMKSPEELSAFIKIVSNLIKMSELHHNEKDKEMWKAYLDTLEKM